MGPEFAPEFTRRWQTLQTAMQTLHTTAAAATSLATTARRAGEPDLAERLEVLAEQTEALAEAAASWLRAGRPRCP